MDSKPNSLEKFIIILILLNVLAVILETVKPIRDEFHSYFYFFELLSVAVFTIEYLFRGWIAVKSESEKGLSIQTRLLRYVFSPYALIDLLAILPFYLPLIFKVDLRFIRIFRVFRILRVLKLKRYSNAFSEIGQVIIHKKEELLITLAAVIMLIIVSSAFMFYFEHEVQPDKFSSIPETMWWAVVTLTSVGYGDLIPVTVAGKIFGAIISISGIAMFGLPAGIIASGFTEIFDKRKAAITKCPHCKKDLHST